MCDRRAYTPLMEALRDKSNVVVAFACKALAKHDRTLRCADNAAQGAEALAELLQHTPPGFSKDDLVALLAATRTDKAIGVLTALLNDKQAEDALRAEEGPNSYCARYRAAPCLGEMLDPRAAEALKQGLGSRNSEIARAAADSLRLGETQDPEADLACLRKLLQSRYAGYHPERHTRQSAAKSVRSD
jgi:HEAT repeat protein